MNNHDTLWQAAPPLLALDDGVVHIWRVDLDQPQHDRVALGAVLTQDELARAERFVFARDRDRFIIGRGLVRRVLAAYASYQPESLRFGYSAYGKPFLVVPNDSGLHFNLSHSQRLALIAVTRQGRVGVDIEYIREIVEYEQIAADIFSSYENETLRSLPKVLRRAAFFACWTRKEAYVKARGEGLAMPLDQFDVSLRPDEPATLLRVSDSSTHKRWSMCALNVASDYAAAMVVEGRQVNLSLYTFC